MKFNASQLALMQSWGLVAGATESEALAFYRGLEAGERQLVDDLASRQDAGAPGSPAPGSPGSPGTSGTSSSGSSGGSGGSGGSGDEPGIHNDAGGGEDHPQQSPADVRAAVQEALDAERGRQREIRRMRDAFSDRVSDAEGFERLCNQLIDDGGCTVEQASRRMLNFIGSEQGSAPTGAGLGVSAGRTQLEKFARLADQALMGGAECNLVIERGRNGIGMEVREDEAEARRQRESAERDGLLGLSLQGLARECLMIAGVRNAHRLNEVELAQAIFTQTPMMAAGPFNHSSSLFSEILAAGTLKRLNAAYDRQPTTWERTCRELSVNNFHEHKMVRLSESALLKKRAENSPAKHAYFNEEAESYAIDEYALACGLTYRMLVNDDLNAFQQVPDEIGEATKDTIEDAYWDLRLSNSGAGPTMGDGNALYHTNRSNYVSSSGAAPGQSTIEAGIIACASQAGFGEDGEKRPQGFVPRFIIGSMLDMIAAQKTINAAFSATDGSEPDQLSEVRMLTPITSYVLTARASRRWYLDGPKNRSPFAVSFLRGMRRPRIRRVQGTTVSGVLFVVEHDFGVDAVETRTTYQNAGAGS